MSKNKSNLKISAISATLKFNQLVAELKDDFANILNSHKEGYKAQIEVNENEGINIHVIMNKALIQITYIHVDYQFNIDTVVVNATLALDPQTNSLFNFSNIETFLFEDDDDNPIHMEIFSANPIQDIADMMLGIVDDEESDSKEDVEYKACSNL